MLALQYQTKLVGYCFPNFRDTPMHDSLPELRATVQRNCHIADANHARGYTLCTYLLKMREYYRWEKGLSFTDNLPRADLGEWLEQREQLWQELESAPFASLPLHGQEHDPFDTERINRTLLPQGLVYSGGYGSHAAPHFFLGTLLRREERAGYTILISDHEFARDLSAPPAMMLGNTIFIRRESVRRMLWEKVEEWQWRKQENAMARTVACYDFDRDPLGALEQMTNHELEAVILHEMGECMAEDLLGPEWNEMLVALSASRAELMARAVRDHLADGLSTLPRLLEAVDSASLHFYFANFKGMRRELFPELLDAYHDWLGSGRLDALKQAAREGETRWLAAAQNALALYRTHGEACHGMVEAAFQGGAAPQAPEQPCFCSAPGVARS